MADFEQTLNDFITQPNPPHDDIARRAHEVYMSSGCLPGRCDQNWLQAERELREMILKTRPTVTPRTPTCQIASEETPPRSTTTRKSIGRNSSRATAASATESGHAPKA